MLPINNIHTRLFSVLGTTPKDFLNSKFCYLHTPYWPTPSFSPLTLLPDNSLTRHDIQYIENYFENHPISTPSLLQTPYLTLLDFKHYSNINEIQNQLSQHGWSIDKNPLIISLIKAPIRVNNAARYEVVTKNIKKTGISSDYGTLIKENFFNDNDYVKCINELFTTAKSHSYTILLKNKNDIIGGGTISLNTNAAFLTWGAIHKKYRNQGFHKHLLAHCTQIAFDKGITLCGLTTRNPYIKDRTENIIKLFICRKNAVTH